MSRDKGQVVLLSQVIILLLKFVVLFLRGLLAHRAFDSLVDDLLLELLVLALLACQLGLGLALHARLLMHRKGLDLFRLLRRANNIRKRMLATDRTRHDLALVAVKEVALEDLANFLLLGVNNIPAEVVQHFLKRQLVALGALMAVAPDGFAELKAYALVD